MGLIFKSAEVVEEDEERTLGQLRNTEQECRRLRVVHQTSKKARSAIGDASGGADVDRGKDSCRGGEVTIYSQSAD